MTTGLPTGPLAPPLDGRAAVPWITLHRRAPLSKAEILSKQVRPALNLAAAQGDAEAAKARDVLAKRMSAEQVAEAQKRAVAFKPGLTASEARQVSQATVAAAPQEEVTTSPEPLAVETASSPLAGVWFDSRNGFVMSVETSAQGGFVMKEALVDDKYNYPGDVIGEFKLSESGDAYSGRHLWGGKRTGDADWSDDGSLQVSLTDAHTILVRYTDSKYDDGWTFEKIR